jgi:NADH dehydrogenase
LTARQIVQLALRSFHRRRRIAEVPVGVSRRLLKLVELFAGPTAFATWDEAELLEVPLVSARGTTDAERLGVSPRPMAEVLGVG